MTHGTATSYKDGCRCGECREAHRERLRKYRASKRETASPVTIATVSVAPGESVEAAVRRDLERLPASRERGAEAAVALALARLLDEPTATPQHPAAAARLLEVLTALRSTVQARPGSKLATLKGGAR